MMSSADMTLYSQLRGLLEQIDDRIEKAEYSESRFAKQFPNELLVAKATTLSAIVSLQTGGAEVKAINAYPVPADAIGPRVAAGIQDAVWPWTARSVTIMRDYDIGSHEDWLRIETYLGNAKDWFYYFKMPLPPDPLKWSEDEIVEMTVAAFTRSFRSWRRIPERNIVLGEN